MIMGRLNLDTLCTGEWAKRKGGLILSEKEDHELDDWPIQLFLLPSTSLRPPKKKNPKKKQQETNAQNTAYVCTWSLLIQVKFCNDLWIYGCNDLRSQTLHSLPSCTTSASAALEYFKGKDPASSGQLHHFQSKERSILGQPAWITCGHLNVFIGSRTLAIDICWQNLTFATTCGHLF